MALTGFVGQFEDGRIHVETFCEFSLAALVSGKWLPARVIKIQGLDAIHRLLEFDQKSLHRIIFGENHKEIRLLVLFGIEKGPMRSQGIQVVVNGESLVFIATRW